MTTPRNGKAHRHRRVLGREITSASFRRLGIAAITAIALFILLFARLLPQKVALEPGDRATRNIVAPRTAYYTDTETTARLREQAAQAEEDVYVRDMRARPEAQTTIKDIFDRAAAVRGDASLPQIIDKADALRDRVDVQLSSEALRFLVESPTGTLDRVRDTALTLCDRQMQLQIRSNSDDLDRARENLRRDAVRTNLTPKYAQIAAEIASAALKPNSVFDPQATLAKRQAAMGRVEDVRQQVRAGEIVIRAGEIVTQRHLEMATALGLVNPELNYLQAVGMLLTLFTLTLALGLFLYRFQAESYHNPTHLWLISATLVVAALGYRFAQQTAWFEALALGVTTTCCIFLALLLSASTAVATSAVLGLIVGMVAAGSDTRLVIASTLCGVIAAQTVAAHGNRRGVIGRTVAIMVVCNAFLLACVNAVFGNVIAGKMEAAAGAGGLFAVLLAVGAALVLERPLRIITELRLMELGNPAEPILRRLLSEAPASYQASVMVGNLAEPAAEAIGANALLCRVSAMYHDIGKLKRPFFFVENLLRGADNPHERLSPYLSALILISHVKDGMELAHEAGLPAEVAAVIPQHHGTSLIIYFYDKALRAASEGEPVSEASFRYPGPKPQTKETAIIMLADVVEAASRTLDDPSPTRILEMIDSLVGAKVDDGQLDECPLTFHDLMVVKQSFLETLSAAFHHRIRYPEQIHAEAQKVAHEEHRRGAGPVAPVPALTDQRPDGSPDTQPASPAR